jgi:hypothetical protein
MRLPSKVTPFKDSTLSLLPLLLNEIRERDISPTTLFGKIKNEAAGISNFLEALDCLFVLGKVRLNEQTEILSYVD